MPSGQVLVVDDEPNIRALASVVLKQQGYTVTQAENGRQALSAIEQNDGFTFILTDIRMPELDGIELTRHIRAGYPDLRIVIMSAYPKDAGEALRLGADRYLHKPFSYSQLVAIVRDLSAQT